MSTSVDPNGLAAPTDQHSTMTPVTQQETHKITKKGVWLNRAVVTTSGDLDASYRLPRRNGSARLAELMEIQRQAGIVHVHREFGVPYDDVAILDTIELRMCGQRPPNAVIGRINVSASKSVPRRTPTRNLEQRYQVTTPAGVSAIGMTQARFVPSSVYERLRNRGEKSSPSGRSDDHGAPTWQEEPFAPDPDDPVLSDHGADHISAMSLVCEVEAIVDRHCGPDSLASLRVEFNRYAELHPRPVIRLRAMSDDAFEGFLVQNGETKAVFTGTVSLSERASTATGLEEQR